MDKPSYPHRIRPCAAGTINVTGAMAAMLTEIGFPVEALRGVALVGPAAGLVAHIYAEKQMSIPRALLAMADCDFMPDSPNAVETAALVLVALPATLLPTRSVGFPCVTHKWQKIGADIRLDVEDARRWREMVQIGQGADRRRRAERQRSWSLFRNLDGG